MRAYASTGEQRCWVHKTANVLNKLPKGLHNKAKQHLQEIWMAETRTDAEAAFDFFRLFDVSSGIEKISEGGGDQVDHGDEGGGVAVAPCPGAGSLEQAVHGLHAGVGVG